MPMGTGPMGTSSLGGLFDAVVVDASTIDVTTVALDPVFMTDASRWSVTPVGLGDIVTVVSVTEQVSETQWRLSLTPGMSLGSLAYTITFDDTGSGLPVDSACLSLTVLSPAAAAVVPTPLTALLTTDLPFDIANPQLVRDAAVIDPPPLGQYQVTDRGDFALDNRLQSLRKRIMRRISTSVGGFALLPGYGFAIAEKGIVRPSELVRLAADAKAQTEREPEVVRATVSVQQLRTAPEIVVVFVKARTTLGIDVEANQRVDLRPTGRF